MPPRGSKKNTNPVPEAPDPFSHIAFDESRFRLSGSIEVPTNQKWSTGDVVDISFRAKVVEVGFDEHDSGHVVRKHVGKLIGGLKLNSESIVKGKPGDNTPPLDGMGEGQE